MVSNNKDITTIKIERYVKDRLNSLKKYDEETYNKVVKRLIDYKLNEDTIFPNDNQQK